MQAKFDAVLNSAVAWAEIDLDAIAANVSAFRRHVGAQVEVIAVVKANAYGHGAVPVARAALEAGATRLAVHRLLEGVELRRAGLQAPILVMGSTPPSGAGLVVEWNLTPTVTTVELAEALSAQALSNQPAAPERSLPVHVKVDTGMNRYGLISSEVLEFLGEIRRLPGLAIEGLFTHFATADWEDATFVRQQLDEFNALLRSVRRAGFEIPVVHAANSAATMRYPEAHFNAVRIGIAMYGLQPSAEWELPFELHPALALKSRVVRLHRLEAGAAVGYGRTFIAQSDLLAALVPVGYGDGYHRALSNKGSVLVRGERAPVIGRVSMDQIVVDVTGIDGVQQDDEVVLIGRQGDECIHAEEVAALAGTINYEVTTSLLPRVVRVYRRDGEVVGIVSISGLYKHHNET